MKTKQIFSDDLSKTEGVEFIDYAKVKIKSTNVLEGGIIKVVLAYIYLFTAITILIFICSK